MLLVTLIAWFDKQKDEVKTINDNDVSYDTIPVYDTDNEDEINPFCDANSVYDTDPVYDTEDEGEIVEELTVVENQIPSPMFVITKTGDYKVHNEFSSFSNFYKHDLLSRFTQEIRIGSILDRESVPVFYVHVHFKVWELFAIWKPWVKGIRDEDSRASLFKGGGYDTCMDSEGPYNDELVLATWQGDMAGDVARFVSMVMWTGIKVDG